MALHHLWVAYFRLRRRKAQGFNGHAPLEWPDIDAFQRNAGVALTPQEIEIIELVDDAFCSAMAEEQTEAEANRGVREIAADTAKRVVAVKE